MTASDLDEAVRIMRRGHFDAILLSYTLPSRTVDHLAEAARQYCPDCPVIAIAQSNTQDRRIAPDAVAIAEEGPQALLAALSQVLKPI
ncbi:MAG TPA: response regulator [Terriglobales bacterium]